MAIEVRFPGSLRIRAGGVVDQATSPTPDWGVYADECWKDWPGVVLDWPDFGVPADDEQAINAVTDAIKRARQRQDVLVGCHGGVGRTGTILAAVAIACGVPPAEACAWVRRHYHPSAVETDDQHKWITEVAGRNPTITAMGEKARARQIDKCAGWLRAQTREALEVRHPLPTLAWAIPGELAITQRPLRAHPDPRFGASRQDLPAEARPAIDAWLSSLVDQGIRSAIILTSNKELAHYDAPAGQDGGLLGLFRNAGLKVVHMPADDPAHDVTAKAAFDAAVDGIAAAVADRLWQLPLPAVLQCSAAIDRSPPVAARVAFHAEVTRG